MSLFLKTSTIKPPRRFESLQEERARGFTLLELLIALAVLAVLLTVVTVTFRTALRTMDTFETRSQVFHSSRMTFSLFLDELQSAVLSTPFQKPNLLGSPETFRGISFDRISFDSHNFRRYPGASPGTNPVTYDWWVEKDSLFHRETPTLFGIFKPLDSLPQLRKDRPLDYTSGVFPVSQAVQDFRIRYYDDGQWISEWSSRVKNKLPHAVSLELTLQLPNSGDQKFSTFVRLPRGHQETF